MARSNGAPTWSASSPTRPTITRLTGALLLEQPDEGAVQRARYMTVVAIRQLDENTAGRLPSPGHMTNALLLITCPIEPQLRISGIRLREKRPGATSIPPLTN